MPNQPLYFLPKGVKAVVYDEEMLDGYNHVILAESSGNVNVEFEDGTSHIYVVTSAPGKIYGVFSKVLSTSTTVSAANLFRYRVGIA